MNYFLKEDLKKYDNFTILSSIFYIKNSMKKQEYVSNNSVYIIPWFHNVVDSSLKNKNTKKEILNEISSIDYLICEGPKNKKFHNLINRFNGSTEKFVYESKKLMPSINKPSLYTLFDFIKIFQPKPVFIGINQNIPVGLERDLFLCSSIHKTLNILNLNNSSAKIGILIGQSHVDSIIYYLNKKNIKTIKSKTVGKTSNFFPKEKTYFNEFVAIPNLELKMKYAIKEIVSILI
jgi:hypothetical protein